MDSQLLILVPQLPASTVLGFCRLGYRGQRGQARHRESLMT